MNLCAVGATLYVKLISVCREKTTLLFTAAFPILLILVFGTIFAGQDDVNFSLTVQDLDQSKASAEAIEALGRKGTFKTTQIDPAVDAEQYLTDHKIDLVLVIPKGFEAFLVQRMDRRDVETSVTVTSIYDPGSSFVSTKLKLLNGALAAANLELSGTPPFIHSVEQSIFTKKYQFIDFFIPGIIAMTVMTLSLFGTVYLNTELRQKGIIRKLCTTPITRSEWLLSDILYHFLLALLSTAAMLLVSYAAFPVHLRINAWLPTFVLLNVFAFVGVGMILTRFVKEAQSAAAAANAISFPMMFLSGSFFPIDLMPGFLQTLAKFLPLYYVNEGLRASMVYEDHTAALRDAAIIGAFAGAVFILGVFATRWEE